MNRLKKNIKAIVLDVDGTLTDGTINIGTEGELYKSFYCRDGLAIIDARQKGKTIVILTSRISGIVDQRAKELGIDVVIQKAGNNKDQILKEFMADNKLKKEETAYIGDDRNDLLAMDLCAIAGCPGDAIWEIKEKADFVCKSPGGRGAVREFIDWLLAE